MGWRNRQGLLNIHAKLKGVEKNFEEWAKLVSSELKYIVLERLDSGEFLGGAWQNKPYSTNAIKAHKLGWVNVRNDSMTIAGIGIDRDDWYWGGYSEEGDFRWSRGRKVSLETPNPAPGFVSKDYSPRPAPVFIPGYKGWRMKYMGLSNYMPDLNLTGGMRNNLDTLVERGVGSNQYQTRINVSFEIEQSFADVARITDYYRQWINITPYELEDAIRETGGFFI